MADINLESLNDYFLNPFPEPDQKTGEVQENPGQNANQSEPIIQALLKKADLCITDIKTALGMCEIDVKQLDVLSRDLPRERLLQQLPIVSPQCIYQLMVECRKEYELLINLRCEQLAYQH